MIDDILKAMRVHTLENPTHGLNCSCKDEFLRNIRAELREGLLFDEFNYVGRVMAGTINVRCPECQDEGKYWTEWSDSALRSPRLMALVLEMPEDEPLALIRCSRCNPPEELCFHDDYCGMNHTTSSSDFYCDHHDHCDRDHG